MLELLIIIGGVVAFVSLKRWVEHVAAGIAEEVSREVAEEVVEEKIETIQKNQGTNTI